MIIGKNQKKTNKKIFDGKNVRKVHGMRYQS